MRETHAEHYDLDNRVTETMRAEVALRRLISISTGLMFIFIICI